MSTTSRIVVVGALVIVAIAATVTVRHVSTATPSSGSPAEALSADFANLQQRLDAEIGVALSPVGGTAPPVLLGSWSTGPAWSTMKVPVMMAALRAPDSREVTPEMIAAITQSDNAAAEAVWTSLGGASTAARKVEAVLAEFGDTTVVQHEKVRPEYSAFGQTDWSLAHQSRFLSAAACDSRSDPVLALMGAVAPDQIWGLGAIPGTKFKGGWGPSVSGEYLVRQIALIPTPSGLSAVAVAAQPNSGSYEDGIANLTEVSNWLMAHNAALPSGRCQPS